MSSSTKEHYLVAKKKKEDQAMLPFFERLFTFRNGLYHPKTMKKLFIYNKGKCVKSECSSEYTIHKAKVLIPKNILSLLNITDDDTAPRIVICFSHFSQEDRINFLIHGSFPKEVSLIRNVKKSDSKSDVEPEPKKTRICAEAINRDSSWVTLLSHILIIN
jgi:hypothetical protein